VLAPIKQFDDFAPDALAVRSAVIAGGFTSEQGPDGAIYTGISQYQVPEWFDRISHFLGQTITPKLSAFRINYAGEVPHSWVHSDDICAKYASVLYLNPAEQCSGGTAFWAHEKFGNRLFTDAELEAMGMDWTKYHQTMTAEWKELKPWKQEAFVPMQFNRFITYPTCFFHSRFPFEGFGTRAEDGRLIWICFYDIEGNQ
jgi:hypothetical protein